MDENSIKHSLELFGFDIESATRIVHILRDSPSIYKNVREVEDLVLLYIAGASTELAKVKALVVAKHILPFLG